MDLIISLFIQAVKHKPFVIHHHCSYIHITINPAQELSTSILIDQNMNLVTMHMGKKALFHGFEMIVCHCAGHNGLVTLWLSPQAHLVIEYPTIEYLVSRWHHHSGRVTDA